jgi:quinol monooxygenase YgiN
MAEPLTTAWFAVRFDSQTFGIFDAFESDEGRQAHLKGPIAAALMQHAAELLAKAPEIRHVEVLADKLPGAK